VGVRAEAEFAVEIVSKMAKAIMAENDLAVVRVVIDVFPFGDS